MTGFGRGRCEVAGRRLIVEIRSVNHRFLDVKQRLPWSDPVIEQRIALELRKRVDRGSVTVAVRDEGGTDAAPEVTLNVPLARSYGRALQGLAEACGVGSGALSEAGLAYIAAQPGVIVVGDAAVDPEQLWQSLAPGVAAAVDELASAREREGAALGIDLATRIDRLRSLCAALDGLAEGVPAEFKRRLEERLARLAPGGSGVTVDPQRLAQEVAILADRSDVSEELTRLRTHLDEVGRLIASSPGPCGRRLDFLAQELHREVNTLGAKAQSAEMVTRVVDAKTEVERLREQVQNVE